MSILVTRPFPDWTNTAATLLFFCLWMLPWTAHTDTLLCESFLRAGVDENIIENMLGAANGGYLYQIEKDTSHVEFRVAYSSKGHIHGSFKEFEGGLSLSPATSKVSQALLLIRAGSLATGNTFFDSIANGAGFFNTNQYPEMLFISNEILWTSTTTAKLFGDLTLLGQTRTIVFDITVSPITFTNLIQSQKLMIKAQAIIKRSNFGINGYSRLIGDVVHLSIEFGVRRVNIS